MKKLSFSYQFETASNLNEKIQVSGNLKFLDLIAHGLLLNFVFVEDFDCDGYDDVAVLRGFVQPPLARITHPILWRRPLRRPAAVPHGGRPRRGARAAAQRSGGPGRRGGPAPGPRKRERPLPRGDVGPHRPPPASRKDSGLFRCPWPSPRGRRETVYDAILSKSGRNPTKSLSATQAARALGARGVVLRDARGTKTECKKCPSINDASDERRAET